MGGDGVIADGVSSEVAGDRDLTRRGLKDSGGLRQFTPPVSAVRSQRIEAIAG